MLGREIKISPWNTHSQEVINLLPYLYTCAYENVINAVYCKLRISGNGEDVVLFIIIDRFTLYFTENSCIQLLYLKDCMLHVVML